MYERDSFFTLSVGGQIGLAVLSLGLSVLMLWAVWRGTQAMPRLSRIGSAYLAFWLFVWLSPQVYYQYYRLIFEGLPAQWITGWPELGEAARLLTFTGPATLSAHGQGVLGWALLAVAFWGNTPFRRDAAN